VSPDLGSSNHQRLLPEGGKMTKNEIVTEIDVQCKQAKHTIRKALQMPKLATMQDEIEMHDELSTRSSKPAAPPYIPRKATSSKSDPGHSLNFGPPRATH
jgi:hypothetical protein|tara:strand:- start:54 stop:353 length:300 start_codon:yes stop_codon:yes gene_type:complete